MATIENLYTGNGSTTNYSFTFPYLSTTDIKVSVNGTNTTAYTLANATTIAFNTAPANGAAIRIYRDTDSDELAANFYAGSAIRAQDLTKNFTQNLYVNQETKRDASLALDTVDTAVTASNTAISQSTTALSQSSSALSQSTSALSQSTTALSTANTALSTANNVSNTTYSITQLNNGQLDSRYYTETESDAKYWNKTSETIESTESWVNNNTTIPTTAAVNARIVDLINDVGGFVVVNDEASFPDAGIVDGANQADSGVLLSITDITGLTWNGSGVSTNATTSNSTAVTITGIPAGSPSSGGGMQVLSTSTLHSYTFVRFLVASSVAQTLSDNIAEILACDSNAQSAIASAELANDWASKTSGPVAGGEYSAKYHAQAAATSASAASTSETNASTSETNAAASAASAVASALTASNIASTINTLQYLADFGSIANAAGTTSNYGVLP